MVLTDLDPPLIDECQQQAETVRRHAADVEQRMMVGVNIKNSPEHWTGGSQHQPVGGEAGPRLVPGHQSHVTEVTRLQPIGGQYSGHVICLDQ